MKKQIFLLPLLSIASALIGAGPARAIEVAFEPDHSLPLVTLNVAARVGAAHDPAGKHGITNFTGEMLLRGTRKLSKAKFDEALDRLGASLSVETRAESMIVRGSVLSSQLKPFLDLLKQALVEPAFREEEHAKLKSEVVSAILQTRDSDKALGGEKFAEFLFNGHGYGNPIEGSLADVQKLTPAAVREHYGRMIVDDSLLVVGTGDAPVADIQAWATELAAARPRQEKFPPFEPVAAPAENTERRLEIVDKPGRTQTQVFIGQRGLLLTDPNFFPTYLANQAFGGGSFSAKLMVEIRVKRGWSYGASSFMRHGLQPRSWQMYFFPAAKDAAGALALGLQLAEDAKKNGLTREEFDLAKESLINSAGFMYDTPKKRVENLLLEKTLRLPEGFMKTYAAELDKVSYSRANEAFQSFLKPDAFAITVLATAKDLKAPLAEAAKVPLEKVQVVPFNR